MCGSIPQHGDAPQPGARAVCALHSPPGSDLSRNGGMLGRGPAAFRVQCASCIVAASRLCTRRPKRQKGSEVTGRASHCMTSTAARVRRARTRTPRGTRSLKPERAKSGALQNGLGLGRCGVPTHAVRGCAGAECCSSKGGPLGPWPAAFKGPTVRPVSIVVASVAGSCATGAPNPAVMLWHE